MTEPAFVLVPDGMFSEPVDLIDLRLQLGLMHPASADGVRVAVWDGERLRHLTVEAARKWADENDAGPYAEAFGPVSQALRDLAGRIDAINVRVMFNRAGRRVGANLAEMQPQGRA